MDDKSAPAIEYDLFISHAGENKDEIARPLARKLKSKGLEVWFDEFELSIGDNLMESIDRGLESSNYGVVILSEDFFNKDWTEYELSELKKREITSSEKVLLPLWYNLTSEEVQAYKEPLSTFYSLEINKDNIPEVASKICQEISGENSREEISVINTADEHERVLMYYDILRYEMPTSDIDRFDSFYEDNRGVILDLASSYYDTFSDDFNIFEMVDMFGDTLEANLDSTDWAILIQRGRASTEQVRKYIAIIAMKELIQQEK